MGRKEDLLKIVETNKHKQEMKKEEARRLNAKWTEIRGGVVKPRLDIAKDILNTTDTGTWDVKRNNGGILLKFSPARLLEARDFFGDHSRHLLFTVHEGQVACKSSEPGIEEDISAELLTEEEVDRKVDEFVDAVTRPSAASPPSEVSEVSK